MESVTGAQGASSLHFPDSKRLSETELLFYALRWAWGVKAASTSHYTGEPEPSLVLFNDNDGTGSGDNEVDNGYFFNTADAMSLNLLSYLQFSLELTFYNIYVYCLLSAFFDCLLPEPRDLN